MHFDDLDAKTREYMAREFLREQAGPHYEPKLLSPAGLAAFPELLLAAIRCGTVETLETAILPEYISSDVQTKQIPWRRHQLALNEFNTAYVRGLAALLFDEAVQECEVYHDGPDPGPRRRCNGSPDLPWEGGVVRVRDVYDGHRAKYWPTQNPGAFSIPCQAGCHHTIRRIR